MTVTHTTQISLMQEENWIPKPERKPEMTVGINEPLNVRNVLEVSCSSWYSPSQQMWKKRLEAWYRPWNILSWRCSEGGCGSFAFYKASSAGTCHLEFSRKLFDNHKRKLSTLSVSVESLTLKESHAMFST